MKRGVCIVGCGALGSHLVQAIRNEDIDLRLIDDDRLEAKNVLSQFHVRQQVGKNKAQALAQTMQGFFGVKVDSVIPHRLTADNVATLLMGSALVVDCLDNTATRKLVRTYVRAHGTPCLHGALAGDGALGRVQWDDAFPIDDDGGAVGATCRDGEHLAFVALVSAYLARSVHVFLTEGKRVGYSVTPAGAVVI
jgi:molybdopterin/thiamine biosynthesis adenylyltransferase